jgi:hypothetical protein
MALGSFAGGLAKGFTSTYGLVSDIQERREKKEKDKEFKSIISEEMGRVGQQPQGFAGEMRQQTGVGPESAISLDPTSTTAGLREAVGGEPLGTTRAQASAIPAGPAVTREQAMLRILERGAAVDPDRAFDFALKGLQLEDVLSTRKDKNEFRKWREGFNADLSRAQNLASLAETNPEGFITGAKEFGVEIRPISVGDGKQVYEAYSGGQKVGQYSDLPTAAQDGMNAFTNNMLIQGAAKFAATPEQFVSILSTADRLDMDRRRFGLEQKRAGFEEKRLGFDERRLGFEETRVGLETERAAMEREAFPTRQALTQAQVAKTQAEAGALGPTATRDQTRIDIALADQYRKQIVDIDTQLQNYSPDSPQYKALVSQRNLVSASLRDVNASIAKARPGTPGTSAAPSGIEAARAAALTGKRPDGKPFTAADKAAYEQTFGEKFPEPEKARKETAIPDRRENIIFNRLTPRGIVEEAAAAGNPKAQAELSRRRLLEAERQAIPANSGFQP